MANAISLALPLKIMTVQPSRTKSNRTRLAHRSIGFSLCDEKTTQTEVYTTSLLLYPNLMQSDLALVFVNFFVAAVPLGCVEWLCLSVRLTLTSGGRATENEALTKEKEKGTCESPLSYFSALKIAL